MKKVNSRLFYSVAILLVVLSAISCKKQAVNRKQISPNLSEVADSSIQQLNLTPAQAVEIYQDEEDLKINCASYQLTDAMKGLLNNNIISYIDGIVRNNSLDDQTVYYDDLFAQFPDLFTAVNSYLQTHSYNQPYEFDSYSEIKDAFVRGNVTYDPAIYMPTTVSNNLPSDFTASATNIIMGTPIEVDLEDVDQQDRVFAWELTTGETVRAISIGEIAAAEAAVGGKATLVTGIGLKTTTYDPPAGGGNNPVPYNPNTNPWSSGAAKINRVKIYERFEGNKYSEVKFSCGNMDWLATKTMWDGRINVYLKDVHKNDLYVDKWITPVWLTNFISWNEEKRVIYNMYEYDWYGNKWYLGGKYTSSGFSTKEIIRGDRKYPSEYYLFDPQGNYQQSGDNFSHVECVTLYNNGWLDVYGAHGECSFTK